MKGVELKALNRIVVEISPLHSKSLDECLLNVSYPVAAPKK
jgi:hypothetical protein